MLHRFYAVTHSPFATSVYRIQDRENGSSRPVVEKIAIDGKSEVTVGSRLGSEPMLAIAKHLRMYLPKKRKAGTVAVVETVYERRLENVPPYFHGARTSAITGLFLTKKAAMACFRTKGLRAFDPRWRRATLVVLKRIGEDHPVFEVCRHPDYDLTK